MPNKRPARPNAARKDEPCLFDFCERLTESLELGVLRVVLSTATTARRRPILFQPPFSACIVGHIGLLVYKANLATLEAIKPIPNAHIRASRRCG